MRKIPLHYRFRYHSDDGFYDRRLAGVIYSAFCNALSQTITFRASRRRREMYNGHARLFLPVCVSVPHRIPTLLHGSECNLEEW